MGADNSKFSDIKAKYIGTKNDPYLGKIKIYIVPNNQG